MEPAPARTHRRTVEEAIAQADAKERIRDARQISAAGVSMLFFGILLFPRHLHPWMSDEAVLAVHIHGGPSLTLSLGAIAGILCLIGSPVVFVLGRVRLRRALAAAARDPITAPILELPIA